MRKVVIATNIAEASITLDGIVYIVDCGLVKHRTSSALEVVPISRASAVQRSGRAGRTRAGKCFRLYTEEVFHTKMSRATPPELNRVEMDAAVLMLKGLGVEDLVRFEWVPPAPPPESLARALQRLLLLRALDEHARLTRVGEMMSELPLAPHLARVLIASTEERYGCAQEMLMILSMMSITHPFVRAESVETQLSTSGSSGRRGSFDTCQRLPLLHRRGEQSEVVHKAPAELPRTPSCRQYPAARTLSPSLLPLISLIGQRERCGGEDHPMPLRRLFANLARYNPASMTYTTVAGEEVWAHPESVFFNRRPERGSGGWYTARRRGRGRRR